MNAATGPVYICYLFDRDLFGGVPSPEHLTSPFARPFELRHTSGVDQAMKPVPPLQKMRSTISDDGRVARFFLMSKGGQHAAFALPFNKIGLFFRAVKDTIRTMAWRLRLQRASVAAEVIEGLTEALTVTEVKAGRNDAGEKLLWIETSDSGSFSFRLSDETRMKLAAAVQGNGGKDEALEKAQQAVDSHDLSFGSASD